MNAFRLSAWTKSGLMRPVIPDMPQGFEPVFWHFLINRFWALARWALKNSAWLKPDYFLDGKVDWLKFYENEKHTVDLWVRNTRKPLPQVLVPLPDSLSNITIRQSLPRFELASWIVDRTDGSFRQLRWYQRLHRQRYSNDELLRLQKVETLGPNSILHTQAVNWEAVCRTHLCLDVKAGDRSLREIVHEDGRLKPLEQCPLANSLGFNCLLFSADGHLVIPVRSKRVAVRPALLSPSASGALEFGDVENGDQLAQVHLDREVFEELQVSQRDGIPPGNMKFLGLTRELVRGGKPEIFFAAVTNLTRREFANRHKDAKDLYENREACSWEFSDFGPEAALTQLNPSQKDRLQRAFEEFYDHHHKRASLDLLTNVALWMKSKLPDRWIEPTH